MCAVYGSFGGFFGAVRCLRPAEICPGCARRCWSAWHIGDRVRYFRRILKKKNYGEMSSRVYPWYGIEYHFY